MEDKNLFIKHMKLIQSHENLKKHCDDQNSEIFSLKMKVNELQKLIPSTVSLRPPSYAQIFSKLLSKDITEKEPNFAQTSFLPIQFSTAFYTISSSFQKSKTAFYCLARIYV